MRKINETLVDQIGDRFTNFLGLVQQGLRGSGYLETASVLGTMFRIMLDQLPKQDRDEVLQYVNSPTSPGPRIELAGDNAIITLTRN